MTEIANEDELESALDALYSGSLDEFIAKRKHLSSDFRRRGLKHEASIVSKAVKPSVPAWVLNQLGRRYRKQTEWLFEANDNLGRALLSKTAAGEYRQATRARHEIVAQLSDSATRILEESGHPASPQLLKRIVDVLLALGSSHSSAEVFRRGRMVREADVTSSIFDSIPKIEEASVLARELEEVDREQSRLKSEISRLEERAMLLAKQADELFGRATRSREEAATFQKEAQLARRGIEKLKRRRASIQASQSEGSATTAFPPD